MVDKSDVEKVAENARIELEDGEKRNFTEEFENILEMFGKLESVDTEEVEPAFLPVETEDSTRPDEVEETLSREEAFRNTGNSEDGFFKGPSA